MGLFDGTQYSYWKLNQSYNLFWILSILGGILALDHLYLRSPLTFLAKILINILCFGVWWIYDATQASFNKDVVKVYGLNIPGMGPKGIGAGSLASDGKPDPKHAKFLIYSLALIFGGIFGLDSFITGNTKFGFIRLVALFSIIFTPFAIVYWIFSLGKFFFKTESIIEQHWEYFGAPKPEHLKKSFLDIIGEKFPFLRPYLGIATTFKETVQNLAEHPLSGLEKLKTEAKAAIQVPINEVKKSISDIKSAIEKEAEVPIDEVKKSISGITSSIEKEAEVELEKGETLLSKALGPIDSAIQQIIQPVVQPITSTIQGAEQVATEALGTVDEALAVGKEGLSTVKTLGEGAIEALKSVGQLAVLPSMAATTINSVTPNAIKQVAQQAQQLQKGGNSVESSPYLAYAFMGTIALIAVSGLVRTYRRFKKNNDSKPSRKDDIPPNPRTV